MPAIGIDPDHGMAYLRRGLAYAAKDQYGQAIADFNVGIGLSPTYPFAYRYRGIAYSNLKEYELAIADFSFAIHLNPQDADSYRNRGEACSTLGEHHRALADLNLALRLDPDDWYARILLDEGRERKRNLGQTTRDVESYFDWGCDNLSNGNYDQAISDFTAAIWLNPQHEDSYCNRSLAYAHAGEYDLAIADFTAVISLIPADSYAYLNRGALTNT